jgi:hypothetical protein
VALLVGAGSGLVWTLLWGWDKLLAWLRQDHLDTLVLLSLIVMGAACVVWGLTQLRPHDVRLERWSEQGRVVPGWGPDEIRRIANLRAGGMR